MKTTRGTSIMHATYNVLEELENLSGPRKIDATKLDGNKKIGAWSKAKFRKNDAARKGSWNAIVFSSAVLEEIQHAATCFHYLGSGIKRSHSRAVDTVENTFSGEECFSNVIYKGL